MSNIILGAAARRWAGAACAAMTLTLLSACGGGGGGGSTPPAAATLALHADATSTQSSGAAVGLHAVVANSSATPTWTLAGPGTLSASTGADVTYTPPDAETFAQTGTATVTVKAGDLSSNVSIALAVGSLAGQHWEAAHAAGTPWNAVAYANGKFVAVGDHGGIGVSSDGQHWTLHDFGYDIRWVAVTSGPHGWIAVDFFGNLATSADGAQWTFVSHPLAGPDLDLGASAIVFGNGVYVVACPGGTYTSPDGVTWTAGTQGIAAIAFGGGKFVAADYPNEHAVVSTDGLHWSDSGLYGVFIGSVAYANGTFVGGSGSTLYSTPDGQNWTPLPTTLMSFSPVLSAGDTFYQSGQGVLILNGEQYDPGSIATSTTAAGWNYHHQHALGVATGIARSADTVVLVSHDGSIGGGSDVDHLQAALLPSGGFLGAADIIGSKYFALSSGGLLLASTDGHAWSVVDLGAALSPQLAGSYSGYALGHTAAGRQVVLGGRVQNGNSDVFEALYSDDGVNWQVADAPQDMFAGRLFNDGTRMLAFGSSTVYSSPDGAAWTPLGAVPVQGDQSVFEVARGNGRYVIVGQSGLVATSTDAATWTAGAVVHVPGDYATALNLRSVVFTGTRFVAVGDHGAIATSTDGLAWTVATSAVDAQLNAVAVSTRGEIVATGEHGVAETSIDGVHWTLRDTPNTEWISSMVFGNGVFLGVGDDGYIGISSH